MRMESPAQDAPHLCQTYAHSHMDNNVTRHQLPCYFNAAEMSLAAVSPDVKVTAADL
jgi:hypothetical protein